MTLDYDQARDRLSDFFQNFCAADEDGNKSFIYATQVRQIASRERVALYAYLDHLQQHDDELYEEVRKNSARYHQLCYDVIDKLVHEMLADHPVSLWKVL